MILPTQKSAVLTPVLQATGTAKRQVHKDKQTVRTLKICGPLCLFFPCTLFTVKLRHQTKLAVLLLGNPKIHGQYFSLCPVSQPVIQS